MCGAPSTDECFIFCRASHAPKRYRPAQPAEFLSVCSLDCSVEVVCIRPLTADRAPHVPNGGLDRLCVRKGLPHQLEFVFCEENTAFLGDLFGTTVITKAMPPCAAPQGIRSSQMVLPSRARVAMLHFAWHLLCFLSRLEGPPPAPLSEHGLVQTRLPCVSALLGFFCLHRVLRFQFNRECGFCSFLQAAGRVHMGVKGLV